MLRKRICPRSNIVKLNKSILHCKKKRQCRMIKEYSKQIIGREEWVKKCRIKRNTKSLIRK